MQFSFPRDPKDAQFLELMIAGDGTHLITVDNDLLALNAGRDDAAMRFRQRTHGALVVTPDEFLAKYEKPPE
jgi:predicted nucleic acid-binding protein